MRAHPALLSSIFIICKRGTELSVHPFLEFCVYKAQVSRVSHIKIDPVAMVLNYHSMWESPEVHARIPCA